MNKPQIFIKSDTINLFESPNKNTKNVLVAVEGDVVKIAFLKQTTIVISGDLSNYSLVIDGETNDSFILNKNSVVKSINIVNNDAGINLEFEGQNKITSIFGKANLLSVLNGVTELGMVNQNRLYVSVCELNLLDGSSLYLSNSEVTFLNKIINMGTINLNNSVMKSDGDTALSNCGFIFSENKSEINANDIVNKSIFNVSDSKINAKSFISACKESGVTIKNSTLDVDMFSLHGELKSFDSKIVMGDVYNFGVMEIKNNPLLSGINEVKISKNLFTKNNSHFKLENVTAEVSGNASLLGSVLLSNASIKMLEDVNLYGILNLKNKSIFNSLKPFFNEGSIEVESSLLTMEEFVDSLDKSGTKNINLKNQSTVTINKCLSMSTPLSLNNDSVFEVKKLITNIMHGNIINVKESRLLLNDFINNGNINLRKGVVSSVGKINNGISGKINGSGDLLSENDVYNEGFFENSEFSPLNIIAKNFSSSGSIRASQIMLNIRHNADISGELYAEILGSDIEGDLTLNLKKSQIKKSYVKFRKIIMKSPVGLLSEYNHIWHGVFDDKFGFKNVSKDFANRFKALNGLEYKEIKFSEIFKLESESAPRGMVAYLNNPKESYGMYALAKSMSEHQYKIYAAAVLSLCVSPYIVATNSLSSVVAPMMTGLGQTVNSFVSLNSLKNGLSIFTSLRNREPLDAELNRDMKEACKLYLTKEKLNSYFEKEQIPDTWLTFLHNEIPDFLCGKPQSSIMQLINTLCRYSNDTPKIMLEFLRFLQQANNDNTNLRIDNNAAELLGGYNNLNNSSITPMFAANRNSGATDNYDEEDNEVLNANYYARQQP